ncbi:hypothetical protein M413DRAFT_8828 [Hebeloma cylindrosporum]|uniref:Uncharacterized protein n=1 Tax=Hebeloma cylindrosporum TaxID=76867 RepID=A0A0C2Y3D7_HEBCY|nr:hypothetical protein M413DRAFT_8828 [Hebeloma cylindrosporum h7]
MSDSWKDGISLKITNIIVYFAFLGSNIYSTHCPRLERRPTLLLHPGLSSSGTIIYQFFQGGKKIIIDGISWGFPLLGFFNATYVSLRPTNAYLALVFSFFVSVTATYIYLTLIRFHKAETYIDKIFIHIPFSLYHGWTIVLASLAAFDAFGVNSITESAGIWTKVFVCLTLASLTGSAATYSRATPEGDLPGSIVIAWSLWAIFAHQTSSDFVHWSSLFFAVVALLWVVDGIRSVVVPSRNGPRLADDEGTV